MGGCLFVIYILVLMISICKVVFINTLLCFCCIIVGIEVVDLFSLSPLGLLCRLRNLLCPTYLWTQGLPLFCSMLVGG